MTDKPTYNDFPFKDVVAECDRHIARGATIYQKFTCTGCGQRLTIETPNTLYATGACDRCPTITDIEKQGCNYMLVLSSKNPLA